MKFITPEDRQSRDGLAVSPRNARQAIIEKKLARYIMLSCGHYTTREEIEFYSHMQKKKGRYYCDICGKWIDKKKQPKPPPLPDEPMF